MRRLREKFRNMSPRRKRVVIALVVLNEIRGIIVTAPAWPVVWELWKHVLAGHGIH